MRRWAKAHPELFVWVLTELELETRLGQILEERAGAKHEEVLAGNAEIVPTSIYCYGKLLLFKYELSPLIDAEIEDVGPVSSHVPPQNTEAEQSLLGSLLVTDGSEEWLVLDAAELCDEEILDAVYEKVIELHRQDIIDLRS